MQRRCTPAVLTAAWLAGAGCTHDARLQSPDAEPRGRLIDVPELGEAGPGQVQEMLQAEVELLGVPLGRLETSRCSAEGGTTIETRIQPAALINALHRSGGEARTRFAPFRPLPRVSEYEIRDGALLRHYQVEHRAGEFDYVYDNGGRARRTGREAVPQGAVPHDLHSALQLLRSWRPRLGEMGYFYAVLGRRLWRVEVTSAGPQVIQSQGAPRLTHRIDGASLRLWQSAQVEPRRFSLWLSEDPERVPLRMVADASFGEVTMTLTRRETDPEACSPISSSSREGPPVRASAAPGRVGEAWSSPVRFSAATAPPR